MPPEPPAETQPLCVNCKSDEYLVHERVHAVRNHAGGAPALWDVDCWCGKCETFYGYTTTRPPEVRHGIQATPEAPLPWRKNITVQSSRPPNGAPCGLNLDGEPTNGSFGHEPVPAAKSHRERVN